MSAASQSPKLGERFRAALGLAFDLHRTQLRKGTDVPYMSHLLAVAALVLEYGGNEDQAIAALLHDSVEDQGGATTLERIEREFGPRVAGLVHALSDSIAEPGQEDAPKEDWRPRKERYLAHLAAASADVKLISGADKLHNCRAITTDLRRHGSSVWKRFSAAADGQLWYYGALCAALASGETSPLAGALAEAVDELGRAAAEAGA